MAALRPLLRSSAVRTSNRISTTRPRATASPSVFSRQISSTPARRADEDFAYLQKELPARKLPVTYDYLVPTPTHLLNVALADFVGNDVVPASPERPITSNPPPLQPSHHLLYFPPAIPSRDLLPDGTDPLQSPGGPFVRRMWAGGSVLFNNKHPLALNGQPAAVLEGIRDVAIKGKPGDEKIFVGIERRVGSLERDDVSEEDVRSRFWRDSDSEFGDGVGLIERRNIVFMRGRSTEQAKADLEKALSKQMSPPALEGASLAFDESVTPDAKLLFRYSALTYNAHSIHLNPQYCREVEGHKGMLVHGPLSFTLLVTNLRRALEKEGKGEVIRSVEYRNLSPLYCDESVRFQGVRRGSDKWEVWALTPQGGVSVKGTVKTEIV